MIELKLPELGENIETAEVIRVLVRDGDTITAEQSVMELESEKAAFPLPAPNAGKVLKIRVKEGESVSVGQTLMEIEEGKGEESAPSERTDNKEPRQKTQDVRREQSSKPQTAEERKPEKRTRQRDDVEREVLAEERDGERSEHTTSPPDQRPSEKPAGRDSRRKEAEVHVPVAAAPATRRLARELGINLQEVTGSEIGGRITREDVKTFARGRLREAPQGVETPRLPDFERWGTVKRQRLNRITRTGAARLSLAWRLIPHVTQHELADITDLEVARQQYNKSLPEGAAKITVTALAIRAAVIALKTFPQFNSSFDASAGELILKEYYHIGVAVDTEHGLLVPVLRNVDRKTIVELARELADLAKKARERTIAIDAMEGGTFTITNLGGIGGTAFTPIINYPEVAILGISKARWECVPRDNGETGRHLLMPLSLSYDHRVINGADGVRFTAKLAQLLSRAFNLLVET
jgi:pyruvate dehydrogenase E2 component (dihydrolipoamide acetyltransferase)